MTTETFGKPETAREALALWDAGKSVFTVEMGGMGPGYEQAIHVAAFEIIRELLTREIDWSLRDTDKSAWRRFTDSIEAAVTPRLNDLGLSGAQFGAAQNIAYIMVRKGWAAGLAQVESERHIQVSRTWVAPPPAGDAVDPHDRTQGKPPTRE